MGLEDVRLISFDCYGTLVDWETGITNAMQGVLRARGIQIRDEQILAAYSRMEPALQAETYQPYREVLRGVVQQFGHEFGFRPTVQEEAALSSALPDWPPFPDTVSALQALKRHYRLALLSNIDNDLFAATARGLEVSFDLVITAEQVRAYKPGLAHFEALLAATGLPLQQHLHAAESLFHDIAPANRLGLPSVWVQRRHGRRTANASAAAPGNPTYTVRDLAELVALLGRG